MKLFFVMFLWMPSVALALPEWEVGFSTKYFDYKESLPAPYKSNEKAWVFSPYGKFKFFTGEEKINFVLAQAELAASVPSTYDGSTFSGEAASGVNTHHFFDTSGAYYFTVGENIYLFTGLGFHYWDRYLRGGSGYREIYSWGYIQAGISYLYKPSERIEVGLEAAFKQMFAGTIYIIFSETVENGDNTSLALGNKPGFLLSVPVIYQFRESAFKMSIRPFYAFSEIGESDIRYNNTITSNGKALGNIKEPASQTQEFGLQLGLVFPIQ